MFWRQKIVDEVLTVLNQGTSLVFEYMLCVKQSRCVKGKSLLEDPESCVVSMSQLKYL